MNRLVRGEGGPGGSGGLGPAAAAAEDETARYVLGLMESRERRHFEVAVLDDPALAEAVWRWEEALSPMALSVPSRRPPKRVKGALRHAIFGGRTEAERRMAQRTANYWRRVAGLFATLTVFGWAALALALARPDLLTAPAPAAPAPTVPEATAPLDGR